MPSSYRSFLRLVGQGAGEFLVGTDWTFPCLAGLRASAERLLNENRVESNALSSTAFVFAMHQGYQFLYFDGALSVDPPVLLFLDGEAGPRQVSTSFSEWFLRCVDDEIAMYEKLRRRQ